MNNKITVTKQPNQMNALAPVRKLFSDKELATIIEHMQESFYFTLMNYAGIQPKAGLMYFRVRLPVFIDPKHLSPEDDDLIGWLDNTIYRFIDILENKLTLFNAHQTTTGMRNHRSEFGYYWLKEQKSASDVTYHIFLLTSQDARFYLATDTSRPASMGYNIAKYWCEAIGLEHPNYTWLTVQPARSYQAFGRGQFPIQLCSRFDSVMKKIAVMAQIYPEAWDAGSQMFGSNELKQKFPNQR